MTAEEIPIRATAVLAWAVTFGVLVDQVADGPPGLGASAASGVAALGLVAVARPRAPSVAFLAGGLSLMAWVVVRASPVLAVLNTTAAIGLFALAVAFARAGHPLRTELTAYLVRAVAWIPSTTQAIVLLGTPFTRVLPGRGRSSAVPRAAAIAVPVGALLVVLLSSADAVFATLLRTPLEAVPLDTVPGHGAVGAAAAIAFAIAAARGITPVAEDAGFGPVVGDLLRPTDRLTLLATVDVVFASFIAVQVVAFFGDRAFVLEHTGLTFAEYARTGFLQMLLAVGLTGLLLVATWVAGPPLLGRARVAYRALACASVVLSLIVLASAFRRLVLYETEFGYTWPRLIPHVAILLTGALLACGVVAIVTGRTRWLPTAAVVLGLVGLLGLNAFDPERFIAERNLARAAAGHELDTVELASLSADAAPAIVSALPTLDAAARERLERRLACLRSELHDDIERFGWESFNVARDGAAERLGSLELPAC